MSKLIEAACFYCFCLCAAIGLAVCLKGTSQALSDEAVPGAVILDEISETEIKVKETFFAARINNTTREVSVVGKGIVSEVMNMDLDVPGLVLLKIEMKEDDGRRVRFVAIGCKNDELRVGDRVLIDHLRVLGKKKMRNSKATTNRTLFEFPFAMAIPTPQQPEAGEALPLPIAPKPSQLK